MMMRNSMRKIKAVIYNQRETIINAKDGSIINIHAVESNDDSNIVYYDKIVKEIEKYNKNKRVHILVNSRRKRANKIVINVE